MIRRCLSGFAHHLVDVDGSTVALSVAGDGPPLLLLHGYPQTRSCWHRVAPALARTLHGGRRRPARIRAERQARRRRRPRRVLQAGDGRRPGRRDGSGSGTRVSPSPGTTAAGASRTAWRSTTRTRSSAAAVLDIVPTRTLFANTDQEFATAYYHWFFLIQPDGLPETHDRRATPSGSCARPCAGGAGAPSRSPRRRSAEYVRWFRDPGGHPRLVRGLPRRGRHRPRARRRGRRAPHRVPAAGAVGRARRDAPALRRARHLAAAGARRARARRCPAATSCPRSARGETIEALEAFFTA